jgi:thiamine pyrophosphokinase
MLSIIFANGDYCPQENSIQIMEEDLVIAADGGSRHCHVLNLTPDVLIGDLDSTDPNIVRNWEESGVKILRFPADKDQTDLELAILHAQGEGAAEILVYGAAGGRLDMTIGNLLLLAHPDLDVPVTLVCGKEKIQLLRPGDKLSLDGKPGEVVSLLPLNPGGAEVTTLGLQYSLNKDTLVYGSSRGISNRLQDQQAQIILEKGLLVVIHTKDD